MLLYLDGRDGQAVATEGGAWVAPYVGEILAHAGISFATTGRDGLLPALDEHRLVILPYDVPFDDEARNALTQFARRGAILSIGGTSGLDPLFGVRTSGGLGETYGEVVARDRIVAGVTSSLHCWGGATVEATGARVLARAQLRSGERGAPLVCRSRHTVLIAADVPRTVVHLQQGVAIVRDGAPAPDGSAAVDDGILKVDDGMTLDWDEDRADVAGHPCFLEPVGDDWRDLLLRAIFSLCREIAAPLPLLWYWPDDLPAVGLLSHDTDGNVEALGWQELDAVGRLNIRSSWCFIRYPETYPRHFYQTVVAHGHEACLHYDAHSAAYPDATFAEAAFHEQLRWLRDMLPGTSITANKNHYLRWEGGTEPWRWMEAGGIAVDQTKGPSKRGNCGFLFGGCHPWFPLDTAGGHSRFLDVLEINLFAQDLIVAAPPELAAPLLQRTVSRGGVAHFLFHPAHVGKPGVADAMAQTVRAGQRQGMAWWTSDQIGRWERTRRQVRLALRNARLDANGSPDAGSATTLVLDVGPKGTALGRTAEGGWERTTRWRFPFWRRLGDLPDDVPLPGPG